MNSIRTRLLFSLALSTNVILGISFAAVYGYIAGTLRENDAAELARKARSFARMGEVESEEDTEDGEHYQDFGDDTTDAIHFEFVDLALPEYLPGPAPEYYAVWDTDGTVLARSPSLAGADLPYRPEATTVVDFERMLLPDGRPGRLATLAFTPRPADASEEADGGEQEEDGAEADGREEDAPVLILALARSTGPLDATLGLLLGGLSVSGLLTLGTLLLIVWAAVRRSLAPLDAVCREIAEVTADDLGHTFDSTGRTSELAPICTRLNELLARLQKSFDRERRFTSDVAHELRTPIAELRALAEVSLKRDSTGAAERQSLQDALDIALGMERIVTALLEITRCAAGQIPADKTPQRLADLVQTAWLPLAAGARDKALAVDIACDEKMSVRTDPILFGTILANLFSNAVSYTPRGGQVALYVGEAGGFCTLTLANDTDTVAREDLDHLFETFWRKDNGHGGPDHAGVGLSLVLALARVLDITIACDMPAPGRFQIALRLPA